MEEVNKLPLWTEIHIQPLDLKDKENSKIFWLKHPQKKWTIYDNDLEVAAKGFNAKWNSEL